MYATIEDYQNWLRGKSPIIPLTEFDFWSNQANIIIDSSTFNRLRCNDTLLKYNNDVINAICDIAEFLFKNRERGSRQSWSIGSFSENFGSIEKDEIFIDIKNIINQNLGNTGLLFRGL